jgi:hypothetical protein
MVAIDDPVLADAEPPKPVKVGLKRQDVAASFG